MVTSANKLIIDQMTWFAQDFLDVKPESLMFWEPLSPRKAEMGGDPSHK